MTMEVVGEWYIAHHHLQEISSFYYCSKKSKCIQVFLLLLSDILEIAYLPTHKAPHWQSIRGRVDVERRPFYHSWFKACGCLAAPAHPPPNPFTLLFLTFSNHLHPLFQSIASSSHSAPTCHSHPCA